MFFPRSANESIRNAEGINSKLNMSTNQPILESGNPFVDLCEIDPPRSSATGAECHKFYANALDCVSVACVWWYTSSAVRINSKYHNTEWWKPEFGL